ncbi:MAG TPA: hypothetical protein VEF04_17490 [Blastocatellia bacterium]|nr:hypothetical protein [Blastocatellia bacterium]
MNEKDKSLAEAVLNELCQGAQIDGIRFGPVLQILITHQDAQKQTIKGQVYLNLGNKWTVFETRPDCFPENEADLVNANAEEEFQRIVALRERVITNVELGMNNPHLIMTLDDERVLFVNGKHNLYEPWDVGVAFSGEEEHWQVIACVDSNIMVFAPKTFSTDLQNGIHSLKTIKS